VRRWPRATARLKSTTTRSPTRQASAYVEPESCNRAIDVHGLARRMTARIPGLLDRRGATSQGDCPRSRAWVRKSPFGRFRRCETRPCAGVPESRTICADLARRETFARSRQHAAFAAGTLLALQVRVVQGVWISSGGRNNRPQLGSASVGPRVDARPSLRPVSDADRLPDAARCACRVRNLRITRIVRRSTACSRARRLGI
jgi:hypothetical protein